MKSNTSGGGEEEQGPLRAPGTSPPSHPTLPLAGESLYANGGEAVVEAMLDVIADLPLEPPAARMNQVVEQQRSSALATGEIAVWRNNCFLFFIFKCKYIVLKINLKIVLQMTHTFS